MGTRTYVDPIQGMPGIAGLYGATVPIAFTGPQALLMHQALASLLHAIRGVRFEQHIGLSGAEIHTLFKEFTHWLDSCEHDSNGVIVIQDPLGHPIGRFEINLEPIQIRGLRNSLELVMLNLQQNEFHTITGFRITEGKRLLDFLNQSLLNPLHLGQPTESIAH